MMYSVVLFVNNSVGIVHESWIIQPDTVLWPKCTTKVLYQYLMKGKLPSVPMQPCVYTLFRRCDTFPEALCAQQEALEAGHSSSCEGGQTKPQNRPKRKRTAKVLSSSFTDESDEEPLEDCTTLANIALIPPAPKAPSSLVADNSKCNNYPLPGTSTVDPAIHRTIQVIDLPCEPSTSATLPANDSHPPSVAPTFLRTSSPNYKDSMITPDLARMILQHLERNHSLMQRLLHSMEHVVAASRFESPSHASLPLGTPAALEDFERDLASGEKYTDLMNYFLSVRATDAKKYVEALLSRMLSPEVAITMNWRGLHGLAPFGSTRIAQAILAASTSPDQFPAETRRQLTSTVTLWLFNERKKAKQREVKRLRLLQQQS